MMQIRPATIADADAIAAVHVQAHRETYEPYFGAAYVAPGPDRRRALWRQALAGPGRAFVACADGGIVGFGHHHGHEITSLYLLAAWRRRGLGGALLHRLRASIAGAGLAGAQLAVLAMNAPAIAFYEAQGGHRIGSRVDPDDGMEDFIYSLPTLQVP